MKLKMRTKMRRSQEKIEASFNPINFDNIFQEGNPLSEWIEEREIENMEVDSDDDGSDENSGGLSPPTDNSGNGGGNVETRESDDEGEQMHNDPYEEISLYRHDRNLIDLTTSRSGATQRDGSQNDNEDYVPHAILACGNN
ncbi:hypothetical protein Lal_00039552 [Lupinus albus]|nr:hypothetical protein Lal_00039552 [Lupinus albus]